jgi:hypothetical protein
VGAAGRRRELRRGHLAGVPAAPGRPTVLTGELTFSADDGPAVLRAFRDLALARQDVVFSAYTGAASRSARGDLEAMAGRPVVSVGFTVTGPDLDGGEALAALLRGVAPPLAETLEPAAYLALQSAGDAAWAPGAWRCSWKSSAFSRLPDELLDGFVDRGVVTAAVAEGCGLELVAVFGGAVARVGEDDTAFSHRHKQVDFLAVGSGPTRGRRAAHRAVPRQLGGAGASRRRRRVREQPRGRDRAREAYGEAKYRRLVALKDRYDPGNLFHRNVNIRPSAG